MSLFGDETHTEITEEEAAEFERQAPARLLNYLTGVSKKALDSLTPEVREWFKVDLSETPEWFDPNQPHLIVHELHRRFGQIPDIRPERLLRNGPPPESPEWIAFDEEPAEAVTVLFAIQRAIYSVRGVDHEQALRVLYAGFMLGYRSAEAHIVPFEKDVRRDQSRQAGTRKKRKPEINEWIFKAIMKYPNATRDELWVEAPEWITEDITRYRFVKRVSEVRKDINRT